MPHYQTWEEFSRAAEKLYLSDPMKVRGWAYRRRLDQAATLKGADRAWLKEPWKQMGARLLLGSPDNSVRVVLKYRHCDGNLCIKVTDDVVCLLYRTDQAQDVKKIEKFHSQLMRLMVAKESRSVAMETD
uniref:Signal recognition particle 9 kDa protein isoform X2 n=1 Tax=Pogona vitticeps TaxID=103695 RepID=A0ABM5FNS1_9SAUR